MKRVENVNLTKKITIVSSSIPLTPEEQLENTPATHKWTIYIKSPTDTPLDYISTVTYKLHDTFITPLVETKYPFVLTETGWGEFNINVRISFIDINEKPISLNHFLKLYNENGESGCTNETHDEIIFRSPCNDLYRSLMENDIKEDNLTEKEEEEGYNIDNAIEYMLKQFE
ncbi:YEATS-like protein [Hamiltosporidium tvaerminnensis]|uniref:Protein AF-9 homolog n=1 Tax=Hamiltosporidium tvaerminnensis TaxID=1176355 RepID=A0A4Q9LV30_9MICR|nr:YEATS-like protein [Hamiltosporidium tvaerminnensis]